MSRGSLTSRIPRIMGLSSGESACPLPDHGRANGGLAEDVAPQVHVGRERGRLVAEERGSDGRDHGHDKGSGDRARSFLRPGCLEERVPGEQEPVGDQPRAGGQEQRGRVQDLTVLGGRGAVQIGAPPVSIREAFSPRAATRSASWATVARAASPRKIRLPTTRRPDDRVTQFCKMSSLTPSSVNRCSAACRSAPSPRLSAADPIPVIRVVAVAAAAACPAVTPKPSRPGPERPPGSKGTAPAPRHDVHTVGRTGAMTSPAEKNPQVSSPRPRLAGQ